MLVCSPEPTDLSQPAPEAMECVPAGERSGDSQILSLCSPREAPMSCDRSQRTCSQFSTVSLVESTAEGIPPFFKDHISYVVGPSSHIRSCIMQHKRHVVSKLPFYLRKLGTALRGRKG